MNQISIKSGVKVGKDN